MSEKSESEKPEDDEQMEALLTEREQLLAWAEDFRQRQSQLSSVSARVAWINGWLSAKGIDDAVST